MSMLDGVLHRLRVLIRGEAYGEEIRREMRFHRELDELAQQGNSLGNETYYREEVRRASMLAWLDRLERNVSYALRGIRRSPGFSATVIVTIALGVGANATMFSVLDRLMLRPPPGVAAPGEIRRLYIDPGYAVTRRGSGVFPRFNYPNFAAVREAWRGAGDDSAHRADIVAYTPPDSFGVGERGETPVRVSFVTANYFSTLGVRPIAGRAFARDEDQIDTPTPVVVISERMWRDAFRGDRSIIGRTIRIGRMRPTVIGVVPDEFAGISSNAADAWIPLNVFGGGRVSGGEPWYKGGGNYLAVVARFHALANERELIDRAGVALDQVDVPGRRKTKSSILFGPILETRGPAERSSELELTTRVAAVAAIVLLIACANVANLMLTRATRRAREIAVRRALGASRARLYEQLLTESVVLALAGGVLAIAIATWGGNAFHQLLFPTSHWLGPVTNWRVLAFCAVVVIAVGLVAGVAPAILAGRADVVASLRSGSTERGYRRSKLGSALLILQAALSVVLLVGAGLLVRSRANVESIDVGVDVNHLVYGGLPTTPEKRYGAEVIPVFEQILVALRGMPGVEAATLATSSPLAGYGVTTIFRPNGDSLNRIAGDFPSFQDVGADFFKTAGVRLRSGRTFTASDRSGSQSVIIVSRKMADAAWPGQSAIGQCLIVGKRDAGCSTVVGVVDDAHRLGIIEAPALQFYRPLAQHPGNSAPMILVRADPSRRAAVVNALRSQLLQAFPERDYVTARQFSQIVEPELRSWRIGADLFAAFGILAVIVAAVGIYSLIAYGVAQRTHEMGVRVALGAEPRDILDLVVGEGMLVVGVGIAIGLFAAVLLGRFIASLLFGVTATDPATLIGAMAILGGVGMVACLLPAWRGARIDAMAALRTE